MMNAFGNFLSFSPFSFIKRKGVGNQRKTLHCTQLSFLGDPQPSFFCKERRVGVSVFLASVLLIAFTIAIGAFLSGFFKNITTEQAEEIKQQSDPACQFSQINIDNPTWDNTTIPPTFRFVIASTGTHDLEITGVRFLYNAADNYASVKGNFTPTKVEAGDSLSVQIIKNTDGGNISRNIDVVRLVTECPNQNIEVQDEEITFID